MVTVGELNIERESHFIGENIEVNNVNLPTERKAINKEKVKITGIYKHFCTVTNGRYSYSVKWIDFLVKEDAGTKRR